MKKTMQNLDSQNMLGSIKLLNKQIEQAWQDMKQVAIAENYKNINKIVLFGMGGSLLGMDVLKNLYIKELKIPVLIVNDYNLPNYLDENTLAILSSYSGGTEETVTAAKQILKKTKKVFVMTTGSFLKDFAKKNKLPIYLIDPQYNPCNQPRIAVGYSLASLLSLLNKLSLIKITDQELKNIVIYLEKNNKNILAAAKKHAQLLKQKFPIMIASEFLLGNAHILSNQLNENGKNMAAYFAIPELNHHLMEGLCNPKTNKTNLFFILITSNLYNVRVQKRYEITKKILQKNKIKFLEFKLSATKPLWQSLVTLAWGGYLSFFVAQNNQIDPSPIPWVDYFKNELKK